MKNLFFIILFITVLTILHYGISENSEVFGQSETRYISAEGGLRMRDAAGLKGKIVGVIPESTGVILLEESGKSITIAGKTGRWSRVKWGDKNGWVFGGFLTTGKRDISHMNTKSLFNEIKKIKSRVEIVLKGVMDSRLSGTSTENLACIAPESGLNLECTLVKTQFIEEDVIFDIQFIAGSELGTKTEDYECLVTKKHLMDYIDNTRSEIIAECNEVLE